MNSKRYVDQDVETLIERELIAGVRRLGGLCVKFAPVTAGVPDRIALLPGGRVYFIELKKPGGKLREIQKVWHEKMAARGTVPIVLGSRQEVFKWLVSVERG